LCLSSSEALKLHIAKHSHMLASKGIVEPIAVWASPKGIGNILTKNQRHVIMFDLSDIDCNSHEENDRESEGNESDGEGDKDEEE